MDGLQDETRLEEQGARQQAPQRDGQVEASQAQVSAEATGDAAAQARADYEAAFTERDARIAELEGEIAEAAKTAEGAEKLRAEMDELRRRGDEERVGFAIQIAGARTVKAAEPWLFSAPPVPAPAGATGLPSAGAAGADESTQMSRWRKIAGLPESEE